MTRGNRPVIAIGEAMREAQALGLEVLTVEPADNLPFHFVICDRNCVSLIRVRRLKYSGYGVAAIGKSCRKDIAVLRAIPVPQEIHRELWARGPDRQWHRYLVLPGSLEIRDNDDKPGSDEPIDERETSTPPPIVEPPGTGYKP